MKRINTAEPTHIQIFFWQRRSNSNKKTAYISPVDCCASKQGKQGVILETLYPGPVMLRSHKRPEWCGHNIARPRVGFVCMHLWMRTNLSKNNIPPFFPLHSVHGPQCTTLGPLDSFFLLDFEAGWDSARALTWYRTLKLLWLPLFRVRTILIGAEFWKPNRLAMYLQAPDHGQECLRVRNVFKESTRFMEAFRRKPIHVLSTGAAIQYVMTHYCFMRN